MKRLDTPIRIFELALTELEGLRLPVEAAQFIFDGKARAAAEVEWIRVAAQNATIVTFGCAAYPERLREIYDPPPVLWLRGEVRLWSRPAIAVVGTRHPSPYGTGVAEMRAQDLATRRLILSVMARGNDSHAHKGAMAARRPDACGVSGTGGWMWCIRRRTESWPRRELGHAGYGPVRSRAQQGSVRRGGEGDQQGLADTQHID